VGVEGEEAGQYLVAHRLGPAVAPWLPASAAVLSVVILPFQLEVAGWADIGSAIGVEHGAVHRIVQSSQLADGIRPLVRPWKRL
jgi:hypothetical protein